MFHASFVEGGFSLPEAKAEVSWVGPDEIFVGTDFGPGSMTDSGYSRIVKRWRRGQALDEAATVFEGEVHDIAVSAWADLAPGFEMQLVRRRRDFYNQDRFIRRGGELIPLDIPSDAGCTVHRSRLYIDLRSDWETGGRTCPAGSLLAVGLDRFLAGERGVTVLFAPVGSTALAGFSPTRNHVLVNVRGRVEVATPAAEGWTVAPLPGVDGKGIRTVVADAVDPDAGDRYFLTTEDYLTPPALALASVGEAPAVLKRMPARFDAEGLAVAQHWATSADGTRIPYFEISHPGAAGPRPTVLNGYGGFEVSETPCRPSARRGWNRAASTRWRTSGAAASWGRPGTGPRSRPGAGAPARTSSPSPRTAFRDAIVRFALRLPFAKTASPGQRRMTPSAMAWNLSTT